MVTPEGAIKSAVRKALSKHKVYYFSPAANGYGRAGIPDIICCVGGRFLAIECKAPGKHNTMTENQKREQQAILAADGIWFMVSTPAEILILEEFVNESK